MLERLGFGVGLRPTHYPDFHSKKVPKDIDWLEAISENFMGIGGRARRHLEQIRADYPIAAHGVGLGIAGLDPLSERYLQLLKEFVGWMQPSMVTDHICWTSWKGQNSYDLLPFPLNQESLDHVCARVQKVQEYLQRPILLENPSAYIDFLASDMHEPDFLNELCARTGCGILLDLNNCMVNSKNLGWDPEFYINRLKPEYVGQFHLAGHSVAEDICIDTHDAPVPDEVWNLYREATRIFPGVPTLVEWDGKIPSLDRLGEEISRARQHASAAQQTPKNAQTRTVPNLRPRNQDSLALHQEALFDILKGKKDQDSITGILQNTNVQHEHGLNAYCNNHFLGLLEALTETFSTLHAIIEDDGMEAIVSQFIQKLPPEHFSINFAGTRLPTFLREHDTGLDFGVPQAIIAELATFDAVRNELGLHADPHDSPMGLSDLATWTPDQWNEANFAIRNEHRILPLQWDILGVFLSLDAGDVPPPPDVATAPVLFTRNAGGLTYEACPASIQTLHGLSGKPFTLSDLVEVFQTEDLSDEEATELALDALVGGIKRSMVALLPL